MIKFLLTFLLLLTAPLNVAAELGPATIVVEANSNYAKGEFAKAAKQYNAAIDAGVINGHIYYNLANTYYRLENYGRAIVNYRRAQRLLPQDPDIKANLSLARRKSTDRLGENLSFTSDLKSIIAPRAWLTDFQLQITFVFLYLLFFLCLFFGKSAFLRNSIFAGLLYISLLVFGTRIDYDGGPAFALTPGAHKLRPAVVVTNEAKIYSGNSEKFQVIFLLHSAAEVTAKEIRGDWVEVLLPNKQKGWIKYNDIELI